MQFQIPKKNFESQSKHFGFLLSIIFLVFAIYIIVNKSVLLGQLLLILGGTFFLISVATPKSLNGMTKLWLRFGEALGYFISPITLGLIFFLLITPVGVLTRLFGRDELLLKKKNKKSYWLARQKTDEKFNSFEKQF